MEFFDFDLAGCPSGESFHDPDVPLRAIAEGGERLVIHGFAAHLIEAKFLQKFSRLLVPLVESTKTISPARCSFGAIQRRQLNSVFPAAVNGCGRSRSIG